MARNLLTFRSLPSTLPAGVLISASDVLEDVSVYEERSSTSDMILFATESDLEVMRRSSKGAPHTPIVVSIHLLDQAPPGELTLVLKLCFYCEIGFSPSCASHNSCCLPRNM